MKQGFTLIELLVVVAIIAILALVILLALNPVEMARRTRDARRLSDMTTLRKAIDLSLADGATLPGTPGTPYNKKTSASGALNATDDTTNLVGINVSKYLSVIPQDPSYIAADTTTMQTTNGTNCTSGTPGTAAVEKQNMVYEFKSDGTSYEINSYLESTQNCNAALSDGGDDATIYETGTDPGLDLL